MKNISRWLFAVALGAGLIGTTAMPAHAERACEHKLRHAEVNYRQAVRRHGTRSRQAEHWRHEVEEARSKCR